MSGTAPVEPGDGGNRDRTCPMCGEDFYGKLAFHLREDCEAT